MSASTLSVLTPGNEERLTTQTPIWLTVQYDSDDDKVIDANTLPKKGIGACETLYKDNMNLKALLLAM